MSIVSKFGGRCGLFVAAATALAVITGVAVIGFGLFGGTGPPEPRGSASLQQRTTSASTSASAAPHSSDGKGMTAENKQPSTPILDSSKPVELRIPAIDVHTSKLVPLGIQPNGKIEVPERNDTVGWYKGGPTPGEFGPAVMGGHVDSDAGPAIFWSLGELRRGDKAVIRRADGKTAVFTVYAVEQYPKSNFPTRKVYAPTNNRAELRLITCGGSFNEKLQSYRSNIIVYAKLTSIQ